MSWWPRGVIYRVYPRSFAALNLSTQLQAVALEQAGRVRLTTYLDGREDDVQGELLLRPGEGVVVEIATAA